MRKVVACVVHCICVVNLTTRQQQMHFVTLEKRVNKFDFVIRVHTATKSNAVWSSFKGANKCHIIIYLPLSSTAALPGSLSEEKGTCRCLKTSQAWVSRVSLCRWTSITLWQTTLSLSHQTFNGEGSQLWGPETQGDQSGHTETSEEREGRE